jgi:Subtilase family/Peptidase inhibitor I9
MLRRRPRLILTPLAAVGALLALALADPASAAAGGQLARAGQARPGPLSAADITRLAANANNRSIILFKNQHPELAPRPGTAARRASAVDSDQAGVKGELAQLHTSGVKSFHVVNAVAATISSAEAQRLSSNPAVQAVVPERQRPLLKPESPSTGSAGGGGQLTAAELQQVCPPDPSVPLLEPEALQVMNVERQPGDPTPAAHGLADGTGVKVGIIADGFDPDNPDLVRPNGQHVVFDYQNFGGDGNNGPTDGREAFLDSGAIASQANQTYDLSGFVNPAHPLPPGCNIKIKGVAPGASLAVLNVFPGGGGAFDSTILQAIEWAVDVDGVDVLNESFGGNPAPDESSDPVTIADNNAVAAGVTVVVSSGDSGVTNTIGSPASDPGVIAVGGSTTYRVYRQATRYGVQLEAGGWEDDNITALSSSGTTQFGPRTVDVVAPGDRGWELCSTDVVHFFGCKDFDNNNIGQPIWAAGGTSLSAPLTSGTAALVLQAYERTHGGARPSPALVKRIIVSSAQDLGAPADHQGAGLVDALKAVQLAESISDASGSPAPVGETLLVSQPSLTSVAAAGAARTFTVNVTNAGASAQTVRPSLAQLGSGRLTNDVGSVTLGTSPTFIDDRGRLSAYQVHQFTVPAGADNLDGDITWNAQAEPAGVVFETLFDPSGRVAAYSLLNQASGHGHVEVRKPETGTWTAVIWTVLTASTYSGKVTFNYFTRRFQPVGSVSPAARTLAPGQTGSFQVRMTTPGRPGDSAASLRLATSGGSLDGSIPVLLRSLVPIGANGGAFNGVLTGGATTGQQSSFQFDVPAGKPILDLAVQLQDPNFPILGYLVAPDGQPLDVQSTFVTDAAGNVRNVGSTMQFFEKTPRPGRWTAVLWLAQFLEGVNGSVLNEPFRGVIGFQPVQTSVVGLPGSPAVTLPQGKPVTATIDVTNTGNARKDFFADARLNQSALQALGVFNQTVPLPLGAPQPFTVVPAESSQLIVVGQSTVPILMDISAQGGDPDLEGVPLPGNLVVAQARASQLAPGAWFALPEPIGPFGPNGVGKVSATVSAAADFPVLDPAVSASSGNAWAAFSLGSGPYSPVSLDPGQSGTITLTITPAAPKGTVVHGFVELEAFNSFTLSADEVVRVPYTYRVG